MTDLVDKTIWITGASSGIGRALAIKAAEAGGHLILSGRREDALLALAESLGAKSLILPFEATDYSALAGVVNTAWDWRGRVDVLINNAGISQRCIALDTKPDVYSDLINIDLIAPIWLTQLQLGRMVGAGGGHIVAVSSLAGRMGVPLRTAYCAAKHGLLGYMDALRSEVDSLHNIKVTNILPGSVATDVARNAVTGDGSRRGVSDAVIDAGDDPMDCADAILEAVRADAPELIFAKAAELDLVRLRHNDPDTFFEAIAAFGAQTVGQYWDENGAADPVQ